MPPRRRLFQCARRKGRRFPAIAVRAGSCQVATLPICSGPVIPDIHYLLKRFATILLLIDVIFRARRQTKARRHRSVAAVNPVLVTGAAGFIGFHVARRLVEAGREVIGIDNLSPYYDPKLKEARLQQLAGAKNFKFVRLDLADRAGTAALFAEHRFPFVIHLAAQAGVRYSLVDPLCLCGRQSRRLPQYPGRLPPQRLPASALCLVVVGLRRQYQNAVSHLRQRRSSAQPLRRLEKGERADGAFLFASVQVADDGLALLHGLRSVGPARHGDVDLHRRDRRRQTDQAVQPRQHAARFHLYRRRRAGGGAADRPARRGRSQLGRAMRPIRRAVRRRGASTISATTARSNCSTGVAAGTGDRQESHP